VSAFPLAARFGLARGFDRYDDSFVDATPGPAFLIQERSGLATAALARRWLDENREQPFFCWVHVYEPHFPYAPPEPYASRFRDEPYHGDVAAADAALAPLVQPILDAGRNGRTLVVLTSDHGESLGEHSEGTHGIFAYEAALKVPLVLYAPGRLDPAVVSKPARHVDLLPTMLDALGIAAPEGIAGRSLIPFVRSGLSRTGTGSGLSRTLPEDGATRDDGTYFEALSGSLNRGWAPLHGVIRDRVKYIDLPIPELYDLRADPREERNLADSDPRRRDELRQLLASFRSADRGVARREEAADARERLRSLGYVTTAGTSSRDRYTEADDPKRLIGLDTMLQDVVGLYLSGDLPGALVRCRELVRRRPQMAVSLVSLGYLERESGNLPAAISALRKAVALNPEDPEALALLGASLVAAGQAAEAASLLEPHSLRDDADVQVLVSRALALGRLGRTADALATLAAAREREPSNAMLLVESGTVRLMTEDRTGARADFESALRINPNVARAHSSLGVLATEEGRAAEALEHWKAAVALDPREHEKLLALGVYHWRSGRPQEARPYLEFFLASAPPARYAREIEQVRAWLAGRGDSGGR
jgi:tetratricopeptide (TPR) repeat protein